MTSMSINSDRSFEVIGNNVSITKDIPLSDE